MGVVYEEFVEVFWVQFISNVVLQNREIGFWFIGLKTRRIQPINRIYIGYDNIAIKKHQYHSFSNLRLAGTKFWDADWFIEETKYYAENAPPFWIWN